MEAVFAFQLVLLLSKIEARLIVAPKNTTVNSGTQVTLQCITDSTEPLLVWKFGGQNASFTRIMFTGNKIKADFEGRYNVSRPEPGAFNLVFVATPNTASFYCCEEPGGNPACAEVKVLVSGEIGENSSRTTLIATMVVIVLLVICLVALSGYLINMKRKQANDVVGAASERASTEDPVVVGLSSFPSRDAATASSSEYVELPKKEGQCQHRTCSGVYTSLHVEEQYTKLIEYASLDL